MNKSNTDSTMKTVEWKHLNWRKLEKAVFKLQKRIYKASQRGDVKTFRRLQKTLMKSWYAKCLAVRRVTQDNAGKKTAGVDGATTYLPKVTHPYLGLSVGVTSRWVDGWVTLGKVFAGVKSLSPAARLTLASNLKFGSSAIR